METRRKPQLLLSLIVLSALFSQMLAWPLVEARFVSVPVEEEDIYQRAINFIRNISRNAFLENDRSARHANEIFTRDLSRLLDDLSDKPEAFNEKRDLDNIAENDKPVKRSLHSTLSDVHIGQILRAALRWYLEPYLKEEKKDGERPKN